MLLQIQICIELKGKPHQRVQGGLNPLFSEQHIKSKEKILRYWQVVTNPGFPIPLCHRSRNGEVPLWGKLPIALQKPALVFSLNLIA